jgi:hypothetical protein
MSKKKPLKSSLPRNKKVEEEEEEEERNKKKIHIELLHHMSKIRLTKLTNSTVGNYYIFIYSSYTPQGSRYLSM